MAQLSSTNILGNLTTSGSTFTQGSAFLAGNLAIGTTSPNSPLHIWVATATASAIIGSGATGDAQIVLDAANGDGIGSDYYIIKHARTGNSLQAVYAGTAVLTVTSAGALTATGGLISNSLDARTTTTITIATDVASDAIYVRNANVSGYSGISFKKADDSAIAGYIGAESGNAGNLRYNSVTGSHTWYSTGTQRLSLDSSGKMVQTVANSSATAGNATAYDIAATRSGAVASGSDYTKGLMYAFTRTNATAATTLEDIGGYFSVTGQNLANQKTYGIYAYSSAAGTSASFATAVHAASRFGANNYAFYADAQSGTNNYALYVAAGNVNLQPLTASTALALDANKNIVSVTNTGSGNNVLATSPTLTTPTINDIVASGAADLWSELTSSNATLMSGQTSGTIVMGGAAQTGSITVGQSTGAQTLNLGTGATAAATTKTINIGTAGVASSITNINIGSSTASSTGTTTISSLTNVIISKLTTNGVVTTSGSDGTLGSIAILTSVNGGTGNGFTKFSGPTTSEKTKTLRDATDTILELGGSYSPTGIWTFTPAVRTSGSAAYLTVTTPADTGQTASTESVGVNFTAATRTWATGALATQRERYFRAPTYAFVAASTITNAYNVYMDDVVAGANATITNKYSLGCAGNIIAAKVYGAVWNDIADFIELDPDNPVDVEYGKVYIRTDTYKVAKASKYAQRGVIGIASDTYGFGVGQKPEGVKSIPIAIGGWVLAYTDKLYLPGTPLVATRDGKLTKARWWTRVFDSTKILATFDRAELAKAWNGVYVQGRNWVKVR